MNWRICLTLLSFLILVGCGHNPPEDDPKPPTVIYKYLAYECGAPTAMTPVEYTAVEWVLLKNAAGNAVWSLSAQDYSHLQTNTATTIKAVKQLKGQRDFWRDCVARSQEVIEARNEETPR